MATPSVSPDNIYWREIDPTAPTNFALDFVGSNKRVLELGPAAGHFTRAMVANGCRVVGVEVDPEAAASAEEAAERMIVGDLSDPKVIESAIDDERFDVVVAGDVLEHLPNPTEVLRACRGALTTGGYVVLSIPNIAHADIKLQLLAGRFDYRDTGLLDRTHLHFFTLGSIEEMLRDAGLMMIDLRRVVVPVFQTEQAVDPAGVPPEVLASVTADEESESYQFVIRAVVHDGNAEVARLADRAVALHGLLEQERDRRVLAEAERDEAVAAASQEDPLLDEARARIRELEVLAAERQRHIDGITGSRSYRLMAPFRKLFARRS